MGRLIETVGNYAENPYHIAQAEASVYCVEELCFALSKNAFVLDRGILDLRLVKWLETQCGLSELARKLQTLVYGNASPSAFVGAILEYAHFGTEKSREEIREKLRLSADTDQSVRKKNFADHLTDNGHYEQAVIAYEKALAEIPFTDHVLRSEALYNKGVALCRLFSFEAAAEAFFAAYEENYGNEEAALSYLTTLRMCLSETDYISFIAVNPVWYDQSLEVEKRMEAAGRVYEDSGAYKEAKERQGERLTEYYERVSEKLAKLQREYREMVAKP